MAIIEKPNMWLANNDKLNLHIKRKFKMIDRLKENGSNENQRGVVKVEDGYVYNEMLVHINYIEDRGDFWYIGFTPTGKDRGRCGFGCTRYYKNSVPEYGTIAFIECE